jgi:hypothetical protein
MYGLAQSNKPRVTESVLLSANYEMTGRVRFHRVWLTRHVTDSGAIVMGVEISGGWESDWFVLINRLY